MENKKIDWTLFYWLLGIYIIIGFFFHNLLINAFLGIIIGSYVLYLEREKIKNKYLEFIK
jgi:hypothetical protein